MADVTVKTQRLPGVGWRYSVPADQGRQLMIVVEDRGPRHLVLVDPSLDEPLMTVRLSDNGANVVAALLTGARFHIETPEDEVLGRAPEEAVVWVLTVGSGSPAVDRPAVGVLRTLGLDAALLEVISERFPEPGEDGTQRPIEAGDKLVVVGRRSQLESMGSLV